MMFHGVLMQRAARKQAVGGVSDLHERYASDTQSG